LLGKSTPDEDCKVNVNPSQHTYTLTLDQKSAIARLNKEDINQYQAAFHRSNNPLKKIMNKQIQSKANPRNPRNFGRKLWSDIDRLLIPNPIIFDVGANVGTTIKKLVEVRPNSVIHSFEPNTEIFSQLSLVAADFKNVFTYNTALGEATGEAPFHIHKAHMSSSFLSHRAQIPETTKIVSISTVDSFCSAQKISRLNLLKSDTQGFELHVLKGASTMLGNQSIDLIMLELMFEPIYANYDRADEIIRYLSERCYRLVGIYNTFYGKKNHAVWCDALFVRESLFGLPGRSSR
jgi:FkbM family methyltransferase